MSNKMSRNQFDYMLEEMEQAHYHRWFMSQGNSVFYPMLQFPMDCRQEMYSGGQYDNYGKNCKYPSYWLFPNLTTQQYEYLYSPPRVDARRELRTLAPDKFSFRRFARRLDDNFKLDRSHNDILSNSTERRHLSTWSRNTSSYRYKMNRDNAFRSSSQESYENFYQKRESVKNYASERMETYEHRKDKIEANKCDFSTNRKSKFSSHAEKVEPNLNASYMKTEIPPTATAMENKALKEEKCASLDSSQTSILATASNINEIYDSWFCFEEQQKIVDMLRDVHIRHERQLKRDMMAARGSLLVLDEPTMSAADPSNISPASQSSDDEDGITVLVSPKAALPIPSPESEDICSSRDDYLELSASDYFEEFQNIFTVSPEKQIINSLTKELLKQNSSGRESEDPKTSKIPKCNIVRRFDDLLKEDMEDGHKLREDNLQNIENEKGVEVNLIKMNGTPLPSQRLPETFSLKNSSPVAQEPETVITLERTNDRQVDEIKRLNSGDKSRLVSPKGTSTPHVKEMERFDSENNSTPKEASELSKAESKQLDNVYNSMPIFSVETDCALIDEKRFGIENSSILNSSKEATENHMKEEKQLCNSDCSMLVFPEERNDTHTKEIKQLGDRNDSLDVFPEKTNDVHDSEVKLSEIEDDLSKQKQSSLNESLARNFSPPWPKNSLNSNDIKFLNGFPPNNKEESICNYENGFSDKITTQNSHSEAGTNQKLDSFLIQPRNGSFRHSKRSFDLPRFNKLENNHMNNTYEFRQRYRTSKPTHSKTFHDLPLNYLSYKNVETAGFTNMRRNAVSKFGKCTYPCGNFNMPLIKHNTNLTSRPSVPYKIVLPPYKNICYLYPKSEPCLSISDQNRRGLRATNFNNSVKDANHNITPAHQLQPMSQPRFNNSDTCLDYGYKKETHSNPIQSLSESYLPPRAPNVYYRKISVEELFSSVCSNKMNENVSGDFGSNAQTRKDISDEVSRHSFSSSSDHLKYILGIPSSPVQQPGTKNTIMRNVEDYQIELKSLKEMSTQDENFKSSTRDNLTEDSDYCSECKNKNIKQEINANPPEPDNENYKKVSSKHLVADDKNSFVTKHAKHKACSENMKTISPKQQHCDDEATRSEIDIKFEKKKSPKVKKKLSNTEKSPVADSGKASPCSVDTKSHLRKRNLLPGENNNLVEACTQTSHSTFREQESSGENSKLDMKPHYSQRDSRIALSRTKCYQQNSSPEKKKFETETLLKNSQISKHELQNTIKSDLLPNEIKTVDVVLLDSQKVSRTNIRKVTSNLRKMPSDSHLRNGNTSPGGPLKTEQKATQARKSDLQRSLENDLSFPYEIRKYDRISSHARKKPRKKSRKSFSDSLETLPDTISEKNGKYFSSKTAQEHTQTYKAEYEFRKHIAFDEKRKHDAFSLFSKRDSSPRKVPLYTLRTNSPETNLLNKNTSLDRKNRLLPPSRENDLKSALKPDDVRKYDKISSGLRKTSSTNSRNSSTDSLKKLTDPSSPAKNISPNEKSRLLKTAQKYSHTCNNEPQNTPKRLSNEIKKYDLISLDSQNESKASSKTPYSLRVSSDSNLLNKRMSPDEKFRLLETVKQYTQSSTHELQIATKNLLPSIDGRRFGKISSDSLKYSKEDVESQHNKQKNKEKFPMSLNKAKDRTISSKNESIVPLSCAGLRKSHLDSAPTYKSHENKQEKDYDTGGQKNGANSNHFLDEKNKMKKMHLSSKAKNSNFKCDGFHHYTNYWNPRRRYYYSRKKYKSTSNFKNDSTSDEIVVKNDLDWKSVKTHVSDKNINKPASTSFKITTENNLNQKSKSVRTPGDDESSDKPVLVTNEIDMESDLDQSGKSVQTPGNDKSSNKSVLVSNELAMESNLDQSCKSVQTPGNDKSSSKLALIPNEIVIESDLDQSYKLHEQYKSMNKPIPYEIVTENNLDPSCKSYKTHENDKSLSKQEPTSYEITANCDLGGSCNSIEIHVRAGNLNKSESTNTHKTDAALEHGEKYSLNYKGGQNLIDNDSLAVLNDTSKEKNDSHSSNSLLQSGNEEVLKDQNKPPHLNNLTNQQRKETIVFTPVSSSSDCIDILLIENFSNDL
ncbi:myb-like protein X [Parasteatoda tepidariorum]|uniref:myb-like protein X n=1 Tax=Parasteatoda tepidariorum TaxID=114398 RepID=UPI0039BC81CA